MSHKQNLIELLCDTLDAYVTVHPDVMIYDVLGAMDKMQHCFTEQFIEKHPELIPAFAAIIEAQQRE